MYKLKIKRKLKQNIVLIAVFCFLFLISSTKAQTNSVEILDFLVDGENVDCKFEITLYIKGKEIRPEIKENSFVVPLEVREARQIALRFSCGKYNFLFRSLRRGDFIYKDVKYQWQLGIDNPPFEQANVHSNIAEKVRKVYYIRFLPYGYVSTIQQIFIFKRPLKRKISK